MARPDSLPDGWNVYIDKTSKRRFYNNQVSCHAISFSSAALAICELRWLTVGWVTAGDRGERVGAPSPRLLPGSDLYDSGG